MNMKEKINWEKDVIQAFKNIGCIGNFKQIYREISKIYSIRNEIFYEKYESRIRAYIQSCSSDSLIFNRSKKTKDLFFNIKFNSKNTLWGLREILETDEPSRELDSKKNPRKTIQVNRIIRNSIQIKILKNLYNNKCQICGNSIIVNDWKYSEGHHIMPIGKYNGPDTLDNIIIVCPNCHAKLDFGKIKIVKSKLTNIKHNMSKKFIDFHNNEIFK